MSKGHANEIDPAAPISEQAALWWFVLNDGNATPADNKAFGDWIARSPERIEAFLQTARLTKALNSRQVRWPATPVDELVREATAAPAGIVSLFNREPRHDRFADRKKSRHYVLYAIAASVLLTLASTLLVLEPQHFTTAIGEQRSIVLNDGSIITLNTSSSIEIVMAKDHRTVRLLAGEALFKVAHDKARPFDVIAGGTTVRAVGTQFNVYRDSMKSRENTVVTVVEGKVAVESVSPYAGRNAAAPNASGQGPLLLVEGEAVVVAPHVRPRATMANVAVATAWIQRRLVFERRPLGEVAAEFNRYNRQEILIDGIHLRDQEVTGVFQANDPDSFIQFLASLPGVRIERDANTTRVLATD